MNSITYNLRKSFGFCLNDLGATVGGFKKEVGFLGVVIGPEGIKMEEEKVKGVLEWPTPKSVKDVQKFLGLANYYCQFIKRFASVARPLHDMVKKDKKWE